MTEVLRAKLVARVGALTVDVELSAGPGTLVIVGPNGAGKTSVLSLLLGALPLEQGRVELGETLLVDTATGVDVPLEERRLGYVPQDYALFPHLSVRENVEFALRSSPVTPSSGTHAERTSELLSELGLSGLAERRPGSLSGGEQQRVALARALSVRPRALLLDEPLAALDVHSRGKMREFLADYLARAELPTLVVTHDARDARRLGSEILVLEAGRVTQRGSFDALRANPASSFVAELVAAGDVADSTG